jgi:hypothetical protein
MLHSFCEISWPSTLQEGWSVAGRPKLLRRLAGGAHAAHGKTQLTAFFSNWAASENAMGFQDCQARHPTTAGLFGRLLP